MPFTHIYHCVKSSETTKIIRYYLKFRFFALKGFQSNQGQARVYGRIAHCLSLPPVGQYFHEASVTQKISRFQMLGCQMNYTDIVFSQIPFGFDT